MITEVPSATDNRGPLSPARRVDAACDRFEAAWREGQDPRIEDYLEAAAHAERPALLRALITLEVELRQGRGEHPAPGEYRDRFPGQSARVDAAFAETALGSGMSPPRRRRTGEDTSRSLLFGLLALQNNFIDRDAFLAALNSCVADRSRSLEQILLEHGALSPSRNMLLEALVQEHIRLHDDDPRKSLASLSLIGSIRDDLSRVADPGVQDTLTHVPAARKDTDPDRTASVKSVGGSTSAGTRFRILRPHAKGGLGQVSIALDTELNRDVALKEIQARFADDPRYRARFEFEAEVTGGLEHPGIVPVYGLGHTPDGRPFYTMRFIKGNSLKEAIRQFHEAEKQSHRDSGQTTLALRELLGRFIDVCDAVAYAHSRSVLHRDIKPGNILLGKYGETLVVDWGLAKALDRPEVDSPIEASELPLKPASGSALEPTQAGSAVGSPAYMSPEQAAGQLDLLGPWSDVYGLGATLYHLLTGRAPCEAEQAREVYREILAGEIPRPRLLNPRVAPGLEAICLRALALRPGNRYESAEALKADLERWLADEPVSAWREPFSIRARRWARRNRMAVTGAAAALVAGLIGLAAVATVQARANSALGAKNLQLTVAKKKTDEALAQSEESWRQAEAMSTFLVEAFRSPDPSQKGREVKVADVLDRTSAKLDQQFAGSSATKGALLDALARTYQGLGLFHEAVSLHTTAAAVLEAVRGPDHPDTLRNMNYLAASYHALGQRAKALELFQKTLALRKTRLGPDHPDTLMSINNLAVSYHELGRRAEALKLREEALALCQAKLGRDDPGTLMSMNNLANSYHALGRHAEALKLREEALALCQAKLGTDHPDTLKTMSNLANSYGALGRGAEALKLHETTLALQKAKLGPDHPDTLSTMHNLANSYHDLGRGAEALELREATLALCQSKLGTDHPDTLRTMNNLANSYQELGRRAEALKLREATLALCKAKLGSNHPDTLSTMNNLACSYDDLGRRAEALKLREATLALRQAKLGLDHPLTLASGNNLALAYFSAGRLSEAIALHESTLKLREAKLGPDHPDTLGSRNNLALAYESLGRLAEAEGLDRDTLARRRKTVPPDSPLLANDLSGLGRNLTMQSRWSEAEPVLRECLAIRANVIPDDWLHYDAMSLLGGALLGQGRFAEAEPLFVAGYEGMKAREARIDMPDRFRLSDAAERVVQLYRAWGKPDQAATWKTKLGMPDLPADVFARP